MGKRWNEGKVQRKRRHFASIHKQKEESWSLCEGFQQKELSWIFLQRRVHWHDWNLQIRDVRPWRNKLILNFGSDLEGWNYSESQASIKIGNLLKMILLN